MDEVEAEAALAALGSVLTWVAQKPGSGFATSPGFVWERAYHRTNRGRPLYEIGCDPNRSPRVEAYVYHYPQNGGTDFGYYQSVEEARAACEEHARTGAFPPSSVKA